VQQKPRATPRFAHFDLDVNSWQLLPPSVGAARLACCPACNAPAVVDGRIILHGHGLRRRVLRGPLEPGGEPCEIEVFVRRYQCQRCKAVTTVGPRGLTSRRYLTMVIVLALWLWSACDQARSWLDASVRARVCPVPADAYAARPERWTTLRRWAKVFADAHASSSSPETLRQAAHREAQRCRAQGPPDANDEARVFAGAALAHRGPSLLA
jgi:hypothetical protein